jgi:oligoribonuclease (3'-5' exoribonuclease)
MTQFALAFLDCEFGGLDPDLHDITEIGVIVTDYRLAELASREWKVLARPERITKEAAAIFGYDPERWARDGVSIRQALTELRDLLPAGHTVIPAGQNVRMDVLFLERAYKACELPSPFDYHVIDLATLFYAWSLVAGEPVAALSLRQAATHAGLARSGEAHHALEDARLTLETFRHFIGRLALRREPEPEPTPAPQPAAGAAAPDGGALGEPGA